MYWTTKKGEHLHIKDMDEDHKNRVIEMIRRNTSSETFLKIVLTGIDKLAEKQEIKPQGDIAQMMVDAEENYLMDDPGLDYPDWDNGELYKI